MVEADVHLRLLSTCISDVYKVFEPLVCCLKAIWVNPLCCYSGQAAPDLGIQVHLWSENDDTGSWLRLVST